MSLCLLSCLVAAVAAVPADLEERAGQQQAIRGGRLKFSSYLQMHMHAAEEKRDVKHEKDTEQKTSKRLLDSTESIYDSGIVTFAGKDGSDYIDGAVMLGLSLQKHAPSHPRFAIVIDSMSEDNQKLLEGAGWNLVKVGSERPENLPKDFFKDHYGKINTFKMPVKRGLFLDADTHVFSDEINSLLEMPLEKGQIGMVHDCCNPRAKYNSGVMRFSHSPATFNKLWQRMSHTQGHDQWAINDEFSGNIVELPARYNIHGPRKAKENGKEVDCNSAVIAHYTGVIKPTNGQPGKSLQWVKDGNVPDGLGTGCTSSCPVLYKRLFCEMKKSHASLTKGLQTKLASMALASGECEH